MARIYVIGHVNPDNTDSIAAAVGYARLLREPDGYDLVAARAGPINPQTTWVLKRLELDAPLLFTDASPHFDAVTHRYDTTTPESPLREAWTILNRTGGITPVINPKDEVPFVIITGLSLFNSGRRSGIPQDTVITSSIGFIGGMTDVAVSSTC